MSVNNDNKNEHPGHQITYQGYSHGFKLRVLADVENGLLSINQAAIKYQIGRSTIQKWMNKFGLQDKKLREIGGRSPKEEIKRLQKKILELETQNSILETAIDIVEEEFNVDVKKKYLPESLKNTLRNIKKK